MPLQVTTAQRRWPQFSLRELFVALSAVALLFSQCPFATWIYIGSSSFDDRGFYHIAKGFQAVALAEAALLLVWLWVRFRRTLSASGLGLWHSVRLPVVVLLLALVGGWLAKSGFEMRRRRHMAAWITENGGRVLVKRAGDGCYADIPFTLWLIGDRPVSVIYIPDQDAADANEERILAVFPEAQIASGLSSKLIR